MSSGGRADEERESRGGETVTCAACGAENPAGSRFCERCGSRLAQRPAEGARFEHPAPPPPPADPDTDATVTFQHPPLEPPAGASRPPEDRAGDETRREPDAEAGRTIVFRPEELAQPESVSPATPGAEDGARTVTFDPPPASVPGPDAAATVTFSAPPREGDRDATDEDRAAILEPPRPAAAPDREAGADGGNDAPPNYNYEAWRPDPASPRPTGAAPVSAAMPPTADRDEPPLVTGDAGDAVGSTRLSTPPAPSPAPIADVSADPPPPDGSPPYGQQPPPPRYERPPQAAPSAAPAYAPPAGGGYGRGAGGGGVAGWTPAYAPPAGGGYGTPAPPDAAYQSYPTPPAQAGAAAYNAPVAPAYGAGTPYPAAGAQTASSGNRTLWIILGIVGVVLLLCAIACVGLVFLGALGGSAGASAVATGVATATR